MGFANTGLESNGSFVIGSSENCGGDDPKGASLGEIFGKSTGGSNVSVLVGPFDGINKVG